MNVSLEWLKEYVHLEDKSVDEVADMLTMLGLEVESIEHPADFNGVVVGKVLSCETIAGSKNKKCLVDVGEDKLTVVCGAPNVSPGITVPVIIPGGKLPGGVKIEKTRISGIESNGMICSEKELGLGTDHSGIWILNEEAEAAEKFEIGSDFRQYFPRDTVFKLEITHNRGDCLGHIGVARELAAGFNRKLKYPQFQLEEATTMANSVATVEIVDENMCPRYCARVFIGVSIRPSPRWLQKRLLAIGLRPINNIVDVTNYVMMEFGHPLHAFDLDMIKGHRIVVRAADDGEEFITLDERPHILTKEDLLICDAERGVALAGVMGGLNSEISVNTKNVLLECAYFDPIFIRKTAKRMGFSTDSSYRFERGVDANGIPRVIDRAAHFIKETAGGDVLKGIVDNYPKVINSPAINLRPEKVNDLLGGDIPGSAMIEYLERLEMNISELSDSILVNPPTFRPDIVSEVDIIEEIARIDGYANIEPATHSPVALEVMPLMEEDFDMTIRQALVAEGLQEVSTHSMRHSRTTGILEAEPVSIRNPLSADFANLRSDLLAPLLEVTAHNLNHGADSVRIFESGHIFRKSGEQVIESKQVAGIITGLAERIHWSKQPILVDAFVMKGIVENLLESISLDNYRFSLYLKEGVFRDTISVRISGDDIQAGIFGRFDEAITIKYDIEQPVYFFAFDYDVLLKNRRLEKKFHDFSRFPSVKRDLSFVFDEAITADNIVNSVRSRGGGYLKQIEFFDLYRGKQLGTGKKSISISLRFQADDRTLTDEETDDLIKEIIRAVEELGGNLRQI